MDATANQQQLLSNLPVDITSDAEITEETALVGQQVDVGEAEPATPENIDWNTSLLGQVRKEIYFRMMSSFSSNRFAVKVISIECVTLRNIVNRREVVENIVLKSLIDLILKQVFHHYIMQHVINNYIFVLCFYRIFNLSK
jgi:hypothetical protein